MTAEAVARLRMALQMMSAALAGMPEEVRGLVGARPGTPGCIVMPRDQPDLYRALLR